MIALNLAIFLFCLVYIAVLTYQFQIKEYRFDRFFSSVKEQGLLPERFVLPKKSVRNFTLVSIAAGLLFAYELVMFRSLLATLLLPIVTFCFVCTAVSITERISQKNRNKVIAQAIEKRNKSKAIFIGVTGSFGKSTTKDFIHALLSTTYETEKTIANYNTTIGVAMSINKNLKENTQYFVTEVGAYKKGEIKEVTDFIKPQISIVTGLGNQHLSLFGSHENLVAAKAEIIEALPDGGVVYINADSPAHKEILPYAKNRKVILYSTENENVDAFLDRSGAINYKGEKFEINPHVAGKHNLTNLIPAVAIAHDLGVSKEKILEAVSKIKTEKLTEHKGLKSAIYLYDGYSANVNGFLSAIEALSSYSGKKFILTKGIIELGDDKVKSYKEILNKAKDYTFVTNDKLFVGENVVLVKNETEFLNFINKNISEGDTVLIEGRFSDNIVSALKIK